MTTPAAIEGPTRPVNPSNLTGWDYTALARTFPPPPKPIIDVHAHINGPRAAAVFKTAMELYGVQRVYSMTALEQVPAIRDVLGDMIHFIAVPNFSGADRRHDHGRGFIDRIGQFHALGSRIVKFWAAPRGIDYGRDAGDPNLLRLNSPQRLEAMQLAHELGMVFMVHVADPDTWFATRYADASIYGRKRDHYVPLEESLGRFPNPWIAAHMGGWPEDLEFLSGLLERHPNLHLDASATKWMVRELSRHSREDLVAFLTQWQGRILFGSDIVTADDHLADEKAVATEMTAKASSREEAFDLYASRYWALRTLWETHYRGPSPIADPDLAMIDPRMFNPMSSPALSGKSLPRELLESLYHDAATRLLGP